MTQVVNTMTDASALDSPNHADQHVAIADAINSGWADLGHSLSYASVSSFTISGDVTSYYLRGSKVRLKQSGGTYKYFYVIVSTYSAPNTTVIVTGGNNYSLANESITDPAISWDESPVGFPGFINITPAWLSSGTQPAIGNGVMAGLLKAHGNWAHLEYDILFGSTSTFGTGTYKWTVPIEFPSYLVTQRVVGSAMIYDASQNKTYVGVTLLGNDTPEGVLYFSVIADQMTIQSLNANTPIVFGNGDRITGSIEWPF